MLEPSLCPWGWYDVNKETGSVFAFLSEESRRATKGEEMEEEESEQERMMAEAA